MKYPNVRTSLLCCLLLITLLLAACQSTQPTAAPTTAPTEPPTAQPQPTAAPAAEHVLELQGTEGSKSLTLDELKQLPAAEGWGGFKSSTGQITIPEKHKGVTLEELFKLVGGFGPGTGISVVAKDGYAMTISYDQITQSDFITYDPSTGDEIKLDEPLQIIVAYERNGEPLPEDSDGTLRLMAVSSKNNQVVDGHWTVKWVSKIELKSLAEEWTLKLLGVVNEELDRGSFESCSAPACHGAEWKDDKAQTWTGVPLWLIAARIDDENKHGDDAFNKELADKGYQVEVIAADGYKATFDIARLRDNKNVILALKVNGNPLDEKDFPLKLVGSDLTKKEMVGQVAQVHLLPSEQAQPTDTPQPAPTAPPPPAGDAALTITGAVEQAVAFKLDDLKAMEVVKITAEHPKKGNQDYEGVRLNALLDKATVNADAKTIALDGETLNAVMPGMQSNFWTKDVVRIEIK